MLMKLLTTSIIVLLLNLTFSHYAVAADNLTKAAKNAAKVKAGIAKLGTGKDARIKVKLKDGTKLKGYVSEISENGFTITSDETGFSTLVPYPNAKQVRGRNNLTGEVVFIGVFILIIVLVVAIGLDDDGK